jgi:uncharacterized protein (TIRG00374 family)
MNDQAAARGVFRRRWSSVRLVLGIAVLALGVHLVIPQLAGLEATGEQLARGRWWLVLAIVALEAASLWCYGELTLTSLRRLGERAPRSVVQRGVVVGLSLGRTLPAGNAAAYGVIVAALRRSGVDGVLGAMALATSAVLSSVVLAALLPIGVVVNLTTGRIGGIATSAILVAIVILVVGGLTPVAVRRPDVVAERVGRGARWVARGPLRHRIDPDRVYRLVHGGLDGVRQLSGDRRGLLACTGWAAANWLLDVGVVVVLALTIGRGTPLAGILLAYIIAQLAAAVPITPGGVGIVESAMIGALIAAGAPAAAATTTVLGWRLVSHWLPILVGLGLLPSLLGRGRTGRPTMPPQVDE